MIRFNPGVLKWLIAAKIIKEHNKEQSCKGGKLAWFLLIAISDPYLKMTINVGCIWLQSDSDSPQGRID